MKSSVSGNRLSASSSSAGQLIWLCPIVYSWKSMKSACVCLWHEGKGWLLTKVDENNMNVTAATK